MEWMCVNGRFQGRRFTSKKGGEAGPAASRQCSRKNLIMVSARFNISIFSVYFLYMLLHILLLFASLETERAAKRETRSPDQRCDRQH